MLRALHIESIAVIKCADLELCQGFSTLTGETGAGKSMIIDSLNLLLGNRVSRELIRSGESVARVSAVFENIGARVKERLEEMGFSAEDGTLMLQRTLASDGRSQARLCGQAITQTMLREIAGMLISIHGQSDSQKLLQKSTHRELLDAFAHTGALKNEYTETYRVYREVAAKVEALNTDEAERLRLCEMLRYQLADIDGMKLKVGEEELLTKERDRLTNLERINKQVTLAARVLKGGERGTAYDLIQRAASALRSIAGLCEGAEEEAARLEAILPELLDVAETVSDMADDDREDPTARIDRIEGRLDGISKLKRKYGDSVEAVLDFRKRAAERLDSLIFSDEEREQLAALAEKAQKQAEHCAEQLHKARVEGAARLEREVTEALRFLDMPKVRFSVSVKETALSESGGDDIEFLIATNPGEPLAPMIKIASGGELSRIMLALRSVLDDQEGAETVIFDEIDAGVSGKTARKVGLKLLQTAKHAQVLCVTHSAQIASLANHHYRIEKHEVNGRAETEVALLSEEERVEEIARILGGIEVTETQRRAAREMINGEG